MENEIDIEPQKVTVNGSELLKKFKSSVIYQIKNPLELLKKVYLQIYFKKLKILWIIMTMTK